MKLTPLDIRKQEFKKTMRGYDPVEVDTFLEMVAVDFEEVIRQNKDARDRVLELETQLRDYRQIEKTLQQTLLQAQEVSGKTFETARREGEMVVREAESRSAALIDNAHREVVRLTNEAEQARMRRDALVGRLRALLTSELQLLSGLEQEAVQAAPSPGANQTPMTRHDTTP